MNFLKIQSLPYFLTLLMFLFGWSVNRMIDSTYNSPAIEWTKEIESNSTDSSEMTVVITNISKSQLFKNLTFYFPVNRNDDSRILSHRIYNVGSAFQSNMDQSEAYERSATFTISALHPGCVYRMWVRYSGSEPNMQYDSKDQAVLLKEASISTWLVKNEFNVNIFLTILWLVIITLYFLIVYGKKKPKKKPYG